MADRLLVILPTYNESENLPQVVPAVLNQDPRLEVLVVDDNSPDGTGELADQMAAAFQRVHVLHTQAVGREPRVPKQLGKAEGLTEANEKRVVAASNHQLAVGQVLQAMCSQVT